MFLEDIQLCVARAREISDHYRQNVLGGDAECKSTGRLVQICREYLQKDVQVFTLPPTVTGASIRGNYLLDDNGYTIYLYHGLNRCWRRFVLCKELFHVILDEEKYRVNNALQHLEQYTNDLPVQASQPILSVDSETLAHIAAMEFMFPYASRQSALRNQPVDYMTIAERYLIPRVFVEQYLSESYMSVLGFFAIRQA